MTQLIFLFTAFLLILPILTVNIFGGRDYWSTECTKERSQNDMCQMMIGLKVWRHKKNITEQPETSINKTLTELKMYCDDRFIGAKINIQVRAISENPELSRDLTLTALKMHCDDRFVCLENTYCYKDSYNYQLLDECIEEVFQIGPMSFCVKKLRDILNSEPNKLSKCVLEYLEKNATSTTDCLVIKNTGDCLLPDVQKHCDPKFMSMYKQYISLRLYNLACDGRLRYRVPGDEPQNVLNPTNSTEQIEEN
ncbi:hypothetical protein B9Z55_020717 [Caenorhabditis nigoni]|uniref:DUF19 domain-containing protein n=1 Tax=Caenorhabditis nigoni TaxID=1611254 RepID=A0A2G5TNZ9_9PELO|nr:hypothetical protein B9Z55_020717 [Caenorhabditis nigoni]